MIKKWIINWFVTNSGMLEEEILVNTDKNFLEIGLIDSFGFLGLISACEEELNIVFSEDDFLKDQIFTISGIVKIISEKK